MKNKYDLIDKKFNKLTVIKLIGTNKYGCTEWLCLCECGNSCVANTSHLRGGNKKSCGCLNHGWSNSSTYGVWEAMKERCNNPKNKAYSNYGGRGIKYDPKWEVFVNFLRDIGEIPKGLTLDRINNNGNYCKNNCKLSTRKEQNRNHRRNINISYNNKKGFLCLLDYCKVKNLPYETIKNRIWRGWTIEDAISVTIRKRKK